MRNVLVSASLVAIFAACATTVVAQPGPHNPPTAPPPQVEKHPAYLHALTDLRAARAHLEKPAGAKIAWDEHKAVGEIDAAIKEIKDAAIDDGKDLNDHPPVDIADWGGRLQKARELLAKAHADLDKEEDNGYAHGLRKRAMGHIDAAGAFVDEGILDAQQRQGDHPAYLHALTDLRAARGYLERPANAVVKWDEKIAIRKIDAAIKEIKDAAIDDGKDLDDHPPIDVADWGGRLARAMDLVQKARADVSGDEDDRFARGLRRRAIDHIDEAAHAISDGLADARAMRDGGGDQQPGAHPAYLHALSDLREARANLERKPGDAQVKWDEKKAVREIDAAIKEIKDAAIDDGKELGDHPAVDASMAWGGRLAHALDLLQRSAKDIEEREDNNFARGLRKRAIQHIEMAERFTREGIENAR